MKVSVLTLIFCIAAFSLAVAGQSRRVPASSSTKPNQRIESKKSAIKPADAQGAAEMSDDVISVDTRIVSVPVRVIDRKNRFVGGLQKENFQVFENGVPQEIASFSNESQPFTVALVLDMSYSTVFKIQEIQSAAIAFIDLLRPEDRVMVISFDQDVRMLCEATSDRSRIYRAIKSTRISTGTSLYEAVDLTMNDRMRRIKGRKAIVLFSDGVDTTSRTSHDRENLDDAMEIDALVYPIRYDTFADVQAMKNKPVSTLPGQRPVTTPPTVPVSDPAQVLTQIPAMGTPSDKGTTEKEYVEAAEYLSQLAYRTGGRVYEASTVGNLNSAFANIASELREFYSIGYYPAEEVKPGQSRKVKVRVNREGVAVRARDGYVVPKTNVKSSR